MESARYGDAVEAKKVGTGDGGKSGGAIKVMMDGGGERKFFKEERPLEFTKRSSPTLKEVLPVRPKVFGALDIDDKLPRMDKRSVATYQLGEKLFGRKVPLPAVEFKTLTIDGGEKKGQLMESAQGAPLTKMTGGLLGGPTTNNEIVIDPADYGVTMTKQFMDDILNLQLIDYLTGQLDRNPTNIFIQKDRDGRLTGLQGIDSDASFPAGNDGLGASGSYFPELDSLKLSSGGYEAINRMDLGELQTLLKDYFDTDSAQMKAAVGRFENLKSKLAEIEEVASEPRSLTDFKQLGPYAEKFANAIYKIGVTAASDDEDDPFEYMVAGLAGNMKGINANNINALGSAIRNLEAINNDLLAKAPPFTDNEVKIIEKSQEAIGGIITFLQKTDYDEAFRGTLAGILSKLMATRKNLLGEAVQQISTSEKTRKTRIALLRGRDTSETLLGTDQSEALKILEGAFEALNKEEDKLNALETELQVAAQTRRDEPTKEDEEIGELEQDLRSAETAEGDLNTVDRAALLAEFLEEPLPDADLDKASIENRIGQLLDSDQVSQEDLEEAVTLVDAYLSGMNPGYIDITDDEGGITEYGKTQLGINPVMTDYKVVLRKLRDYINAQETQAKAKAIEIRKVDKAIREYYDAKTAYDQANAKYKEKMWLGTMDEMNRKGRDLKEKVEALQALYGALSETTYTDLERQVETVVSEHREYARASHLTSTSQVSTSPLVGTRPATSLSVGKLRPLSR